MLWLIIWKIITNLAGYLEEIGRCDFNENILSVESNFRVVSIYDGRHRKDYTIAVRDQRVDWAIPNYAQVLL